ncbi:hypothetical protein OC844_004090 [Tilletia horrida]|nr:hypothetical protein OC844_004090 [Tilletia horrida]
MDLPKRGAQPRKRSSLSKGVLASSSGIKNKGRGALGSLQSNGDDDDDGAGPSEPQLTKAEKRALKRSELMHSVGAPASQTQARLASLPPYLLSKSATRRRKRKAREQLAGNVEGMRDVASAVEDVRVEQVEREREAERAGKIGAAPAGAGVDGRHRLEEDGEGATGGSKPAISAKKRKKVLAEELGRQQHILSDPAFSKSPFAALREHARNALAFSQAPPAD